MKSFQSHMTTPARVTVDPNSFSRIHPEWSAVLFADADRVPFVGERVLAVQPEDDEPDYISSGIVRLIDNKYGLIYVDVDWEGFHDEVPNAIGRPVQDKNRGSRNLQVIISKSLVTRGFVGSTDANRTRAVAGAR